MGENINISKTNSHEIQHPQGEGKKAHHRSTLNLKAGRVENTASPDRFWGLFKKNKICPP